MCTLDTDGNFVNAFAFGGADFLDTHRIGTDAEGYVYLSAHFEKTVDINPLEEETLNVTAIDFRDSYIIKMAATTLGITSNNYQEITFYPNPTTSLVNVTSSENLIGKTYSLFDLQGRRMLTGFLDASQQIRLEELSTGIYYLNIAGSKTLKVVKN
jgi:hypothetical protein